MNLRCRFVLLSILITLIILTPLVSITTVSNTINTTTPPPPRTAVCLHLHADDSLSFVNRLASEAKDLGAEYARFDIWWNEIMPKPGEIDLDKIIKWGEIIETVRSKGLKIIAILGTGYGSTKYRYPDWVIATIVLYDLCLADCNGGPLKKNSFCPCSGLHKTISIPREIESKILKSLALSLMNFNIDAALAEINYVKKTYPELYRASAKGYLTLEEAQVIFKKYPMLKQFIGYGNRSNRIKKDEIYVKPYPILEKIYTRWKEVRKRLKNINDPVRILQAWDPCGCYKIMEDLMYKAYKYSKTIAGSFGWDIDYYQLGNELNHPIDYMPSEWDAAFIYWLSQGLYDDPSDHIGIINVFADWNGWSSALKGWLDTLKNLPADTIDIIAIDHYPGTWYTSLLRYSDWSPLDSLIDIANQYGKTPAIMETGYPTKDLFNTHSETEQVNYINTAFNAIMQRAQNHFIAFLSWYML